MLGPAKHVYAADWEQERHNGLFGRGKNCNPIGAACFDKFKAAFRAHVRNLGHELFGSRVKR